MYFLKQSENSINNKFHYKDLYLIGRKPIWDALHSGKEMEKIWIASSLRGEFEIKVRQYCKDAKIPLSRVADEKLNHLAKSTNHQGIVALTAQVTYQNTADLIPFLFESGKSPKLILLDGIEDVRNFAAICRSALWFGFDAVIIGMKYAAPVNGMTVKTSAGAVLEIPICREGSLVNTVEFLKNSGVSILGSDLEGTELSSPGNQPFCLIMGSEEKGITRAMRALCDEIYKIPGTGNMESLNVSVAAAICMYEFSKGLSV